MDKGGCTWRSASTRDSRIKIAMPPVSPLFCPSPFKTPEWKTSLCERSAPLRHTRRASSSPCVSTRHTTSHLWHICMTSTPFCLDNFLSLQQSALAFHTATENFPLCRKKGGSGIGPLHASSRRRLLKGALYLLLVQVPFCHNWSVPPQADSFGIRNLDGGHGLEIHSNNTLTLACEDVVTLDLVGQHLGQDGSEALSFLLLRRSVWAEVDPGKGVPEGTLMNRGAHFP